MKFIAGIQTGIEAAGNGGGLTPGDWNIEDVISISLDIMTVMVGALAVMFIVIAAIKYIVSGGDKEKVENAKNTLLYAIIGLVVAISSRIIIGIVLRALNLEGISGVTG